MDGLFLLTSREQENFVEEFSEEFYPDDNERYSVGFWVDVQALQAELDRLRRRAAPRQTETGRVYSTPPSAHHNHRPRASRSADEGGQEEVGASSAVGVGGAVGVTVLHLVMKAAASAVLEVVPPSLSVSLFLDADESELGLEESEFLGTGNRTVGVAGVDNGGGDGRRSGNGNGNGRGGIRARPTRVACVARSEQQAAGSGAAMTASGRRRGEVDSATSSGGFNARAYTSGVDERRISSSGRSRSDEGGGTLVVVEGAERKSAGDIAAEIVSKAAAAEAAVSAAAAAHAAAAAEASAAEWTSPSVESRKVLERVGRRGGGGGEEGIGRYPAGEQPDQKGAGIT